MSLLHPLGPEWTTLPEKDPYGKSANEAGAKLDHGKNRLGLVLGGFSQALEQVGRVGTYGANKYTDNGWMEVQNGVQRYTDAMLRHQFKMLGGEAFDPDTGLLHAAHAAWNALAVLELKMRAVTPTTSEREAVRSEPSFIGKLAGDLRDEPVIRAGTPYRREHIQD